VRPAVTMAQLCRRNGRTGLMGFKTRTNMKLLAIAPGGRSAMAGSGFKDYGDITCGYHCQRSPRTNRTHKGCTRRRPYGSLCHSLTPTGYLTTKSMSGSVESLKSTSERAIAGLHTTPQRSAAARMSRSLLTMRATVWRVGCTICSASWCVGSEALAFGSSVCGRLCCALR